MSGQMMEKIHPEDMNVGDTVHVPWPQDHRGSEITAVRFVARPDGSAWARVKTRNGTLFLDPSKTYMVRRQKKNPGVFGGWELSSLGGGWAWAYENRPWLLLAFLANSQAKPPAPGKPVDLAIERTRGKGAGSKPIYERYGLSWRDFKDASADDWLKDMIDSAELITGNIRKWRAARDTPRRKNPTPKGGRPYVTYPTGTVEPKSSCCKAGVDCNDSATKWWCVGCGKSLRDTWPSEPAARRARRADDDNAAFRRGI